MKPNMPLLRELRNPSEAPNFVWPYDLLPRRELGEAQALSTLPPDLEDTYLRMRYRGVRVFELAILRPPAPPLFASLPDAPFSTGQRIAFQVQQIVYQPTRTRLGVICPRSEADQDHWLEHVYRAD